MYLFQSNERKAKVFLGYLSLKANFANKNKIEKTDKDKIGRNID